MCIRDRGALVKNRTLREHVAAVDAGPVLETTGAGDAFNGGLAVALAEGREIIDAVRFGCAVAGISVTLSLIHIFRRSVQAIGWTGCPHWEHRFAASGMSERHSGQGWVVGGEAWAGRNFLSRALMGSTMKK